MFLLSIVATIFPPLGFITDLLGINVGGIPGEGNPVAFLTVCVFLVILIIGEILIFKFKRWI
ncbi:hypothetical protein PM10SUCC1_02030 [Propionigenium maris DSM 9537]|uniref:Zinc transporter n=2 Tax=Propionigenium TaxID=2332 RepID=A0A9W6GID3_9FUSO|nr:hypothetical protein PM10SUCC1_02030 [Propionigenium maris DSM 9537]